MGDERRVAIAACGAGGERFDTSGWVLMSAWLGPKRVGGVVLAHGGRDVEMLEGRGETQHMNVPACRFYAAQGFELGAVDRFAYAELPDEIQLLWYETLGSERIRP